MCEDNIFRIVDDSMADTPSRWTVTRRERAWEDPPPNKILV